MCPIFSQVCIDPRNCRFFKTTSLHVILGLTHLFLTTSFTNRFTLTSQCICRSIQDMTKPSHAVFFFFPQCVVLAPPSECGHFCSYLILHDPYIQLSIHISTTIILWKVKLKLSSIHYHITLSVL